MGRYQQLVNQRRFRLLDDLICKIVTGGWLRLEIVSTCSVFPDAVASINDLLRFLRVVSCEVVRRRKAYCTSSHQRSGPATLLRYMGSSSRSSSFTSSSAWLSFLVSYSSVHLLWKNLWTVFHRVRRSTIILFLHCLLVDGTIWRL